MQVHRMEDYRIRTRQGRSRHTGGYYVNSRGNKTPVMKYSVYYETNAGEISPKQWLEIMRECVAASGSEQILEKIREHVKRDCAWLKTDKDIEEYSLNILAGRIYNQGRAWSNFDTGGAPVRTAFVFDFRG